MPLYLYECMKCHAKREDMRTMDERHDGPFCDCGHKMVLIIPAVRGIVKNPAVPRKS